ncbi:Acyl-CoA-binding domain-containing protein 2 [Ancistrocladus abbreviatus]
MWQIYTLTTSSAARYPTIQAHRQTAKREKTTKMALKEEFEQYAEKAKTLPESTTNENLLIIYGLYKQATVGNVNTSRPGMLDMKGKAKWDAWKANEGKSHEESMKDYITKVKQLLEEAGLPA